ncbi:hypothetical protein V496_00801 [Pseudogymnoascus sp. VKM F-4515 (FW-2607)]|nr:hypothetical protein V496_00801 [Pseudogymnoascus sp. VKM F-4515 (FW-2607)]
MPLPTQAQSSNQEGRILLAINAIKQGQFQSVRAATALYDIPRTTLRNRIYRMASRRDSIPNLQKLTLYEESALVRIIQEWFSLVRNTIAKYGILEQDIYNFDKAGFAIGVIATAKVVTSLESKNSLESDNWTLKTPQTIRELDFQTEHVIMHSATLLKAEVKALQAANEQKKRRERKRKRRIMQGGSLSVRDVEDILQSAEVDAQVRTEVLRLGSG